MIDAKEFFNSLPTKVKPEVLEGLDTLFHFDITNSGQFTVRAHDSKLTVEDGFHGEPKCKVTTTAENFSKLLSGDLNPMMAVMTGKLKLSNPGEMMKYAKIFGLM